MTTVDQLLEGLHVVDLSQSLAGVQASQVLCDFGAEVVHVEPPGGSPLRRQRAHPFWTRGKKSIELDLHQPDDLAVARRLGTDADVVIETFRPGTAERLGLGYDDLAPANPALVYGSVSGFGRHGPFVDVPGYEGIVMAKLGALAALAEMTARPGPSFPSAPYCTYPAAQLLAQGILAALFERERSGRGQRVDTSLVQGLSVHDTFNWHSRIVAQRYPGSFSQVPMTLNGMPSGGLSFRLLIALTADGKWLQFSQTAPRLFRAMMAAFGLDWMFDDPRFASAPDFDDLDRRVEFWEILLAAVRAKTVAEWQAVFDEHPDVWGEVFRSGTESLEHPQVRWNGSVVEIDDPVLGPVRQPGPIAQIDDAPAALTRSAPALDEHGAELRARRPRPARTPVADATGDRRPPLDGVTCLELGTYYAAPFGATLLAELGARVIKIEQLDGDPMRDMLPFPEIAGIKALQGKQSVAIDIASDAGRRLVVDLVARADIVLQSFRAGVAERLGLDAASLQAINPELVYVSAPGYGSGGPCGGRPAYAPTIGAAGGLAWRNAGSTIPGFASGDGADLDVEAVKSSAMRLVYAVMGVGNADGFAAVTVGTALTLGLLGRARGAGAASLRTSMLNTLAHALSETTVSYSGAPDAPTADDELHGFGARYRLYQAADGWVFLAAPTEDDAVALRGVLGIDDDELRAERLAERFGTRPAAEWERDLLAAGVGCVVVAPGPVEANFMDDASAGAQSGLVTTAHHPILDEHPRLTPLVAMSRSTGVAAGGCLIGQHTDAVLAELGVPAEQIAAHRAAGVVGG